MSTSDAFWNQFEKFIKEEHNLTLKEFGELFIKHGDGAIERYAIISECILLESPKDDIKQERR